MKNDYSAVFRNTGTSQRMLRDGNYDTEPFVAARKRIRKTVLWVMVVSAVLMAYSLVNG